MSLTNLLPLLLLSGLLACNKPTDAVGPSSLESLDSLTATPTTLGQLVGPPITKTIGPAGGTITTQNGKISLVFPAGALKQETAITLQPGENTAPNGIGQAFTISPNITFEQGVTVRYSYQEEEMNGAAVDALGMAYQDGRQAWQLSRSVKVDKQKKTITTTLKKANWWALVTEYLLTPQKDTVIVGESRQLTLMRLPNGEHFPDWAGNATGENLETGLIFPLVQPIAANSDVNKLYLNGVDWTSATPKDQSWGGVGYNPQSAQILYVAPSHKPKNNQVLLTVEIKNPGSAAKFQVSSEMIIVGDNSLLIDGHAFDNITVNGTITNGHLIATAAGIDSTGKSGQLSLFLSSLSTGAHPFTDDLELLNGTSVHVVNAAGSGDNVQGSSSFSTCLVSKTESGAIQVIKAERTNGQMKITLQISGRVVTKHSYKAETCTVTEHKTMSVNARLTLLARE